MGQYDIGWNEWNLKGMEGSRFIMEGEYDAEQWIERRRSMIDQRMERNEEIIVWSNGIYGGKGWKNLIVQKNRGESARKLETQDGKNSETKQWIGGKEGKK